MQETAEQAGFRASGAGRRLATGVTSTIGVLSPAPDRWYFGSVLHGIADAADAHEQDVILYDIGQLGQGGHERIERFLRRGEVDGLLSITWSLRDDDLRLLAARGVPVATVGEPAPHVRSFSLDDAAAGTLAVDHLVALGHRDVLHVSSATEVQPFAASSSDRRSSAYDAAMRRHGLEPRPVVTVPTTLAGAHAAAREPARGPRSAPRHRRRHRRGRARHRARGAPAGAARAGGPQHHGRRRRAVGRRVGPHDRPAGPGAARP
ncbi:LacI family DNA-binding transcriptional regulator [Agrococcus sp. SL85]|nr:LacI family DNA-binding transcriptional regulator [Agrococcus sp. SL85]WAC67057.1 LacI family DNA-binding transcriptional regulator [Agrococcus sp. SL85]